MSAKVVMYSTRFCPYCMRARRLLSSKGVEFEDIDVGADAALWKTMASLSGRDTVPQIFINDQSVGGFDDIAHLDRLGKLDPLLESKQ
ncbi:glutaredoxin 3 [Leucothrix mucor]|jgi:glutaredoxin 3|uniref:glutaredoxin 3 n=1 Tax=Leucothrix mucor TaxID=45248 RepID=UPI0003B39336|nr:glutaredoxin 3 [Leucothrix mucor]